MRDAGPRTDLIGGLLGHPGGPPGPIFLLVAFVLQLIYIIALMRP